MQLISIVFRSFVLSFFILFYDLITGASQKCWRHDSSYTLWYARLSWVNRDIFHASNRMRDTFSLDGSYVKKEKLFFSVDMTHSDVLVSWTERSLKHFYDTWKSMKPCIEATYKGNILGNKKKFIKTSDEEENWNGDKNSSKLARFPSNESLYFLPENSPPAKQFSLSRKWTARNKCGCWGKW